MCNVRCVLSRESARIDGGINVFFQRANALRSAIFSSPKFVSLFFLNLVASGDAILTMLDKKRRKAVHDPKDEKRTAIFSGVFES